MDDLQNFRPPVLVGERVAWLGSGSGLPQPSTVRWIGRIPEITAGWTVGIELDRPMPVGGIDGTWGKRKLFSCEPKRGLLVPVDTVMKESSFLKTRHSLGEKFYEEGSKKPIIHNKNIIRKLSLPQSTSSQEFISSILPQSVPKCKNNVPETGLNFKSAAKQLQNSLSIDNSKVNGNNKTRRIEANNAQLVRQQTIEELEKFKKHLDDLEKLKNSEYRIKSRKKKIGNNPESIYNLAKSKPDNCEEPLFLRIIGEKKILLDDVTKITNLRKEVKNYIISEESEDVAKDEIVKIDNAVKDKTEKKIEIKEATFLFLSELIDSKELIIEKIETDLAKEGIEVNYCNEFADFLNVDIEIDEIPDIITDESVNQPKPTPTIRKKRKESAPDPPVPHPRRRSNDGRQDSDNIPNEADTTSILYEPAFLRSYLETETDEGMTDVRGTFRRIDEDELDRRNLASPTSTAQRFFPASVSAPGGSRKGLFSFLRWFKKSKPQTDFDLEAFDAPSVSASPLFPRNRLANAGSIDTLYSIATVSSFAFVTGAQYLNGSDRKKKRRAPAPPPKRRDSSLPNTLETRCKQQHRRSVSESYKDRRSGAFAHVHGKRKAPPPPIAPPREKLYPSLTCVRDGTKKRPAPQPPEPNIISGENKSTVQEIPVSPALLKDVVCNDTLKLERGVLKANKIASLPVIPPDVEKIIPSSPVSPRPWYKRKSLEKRKEKSYNDWMPEVGFSRNPTSPESSPLKFNFFSRNDEKKKDDKRKSGLSLLANISELDREAAEICRKEQAHQQQILDNDDATFYSDFKYSPNISSRNSTKELITLFNSISNLSKPSSGLSKVRDAEEQKGTVEDIEELAIANCDKREVRIAEVVDTNEIISNKNMSETSEVSRSQAIFDLRSRRHHSPSPSISTIAEISEPSSSAATLNHYSEPVWKCSRCTLENQNWKNRCDACSNCKPNYSPAKKTILDKRKSEMELEIDWEREIQKYFPVKKPLGKEEELSAKLTLSKTGDVLIKTETNQGNDLKEGDLDDLRRKRLAFFMKSLGTEASTSLRDAAAKKSLDEAERSKIKGMLKEMKNLLPKYDGVINKTGVENLNARREPDSLPDVTLIKNEPSEVNVTPTKNKVDNGAKFGAINKVKTAEALLVTTKTIHQDIIVRKKPIEKNNDNFAELKNGKRVDRPFELMKTKDLVNIIESKVAVGYRNHLYANFPVAVHQESDDSSNYNDESHGSEFARLATQLTQPAGVAQFKASLDLGTSDTLAINRLLRRLECAIAEGRHDQAATLARELAALKVNCSVIRQKPTPSPPPPTITLDMYVEDKVSHQGPIPVKVQRTMTLADLKIKVQADFQIPTHVQRWILGKELAIEDYKTLESLGATTDNFPIFLYLVAPEPEVEIKAEAPSAPEKTVEESEEGAVGLTEPPKAKGWYFNFEEDRYSFCESDSEEEVETTQVGKEAAVKVIQRTIEIAQRKSSSPVLVPKTENREKENAMVLQPAPQAKPFNGKDRPPLKSSVSLPEKSPPKDVILKNEHTLKTVESSTEVGAKPKHTSKNGESSSPVYRPRSRSIFDLIKPQSNETLKKDLKVISVNAVKETIEKLNRRGENVDRDGWKCSECTLINAAGRPGCAACTAPRPPGYAPPPPKPVEQELQRLRRDQSLDFPIQAVSESNNNENQHYLQLVNLDSADLVLNTEQFECTVCLTAQRPGEGVLLRECLHTFCRPCLVQTVEYNEEAEVKCPYRDDNYSCSSVLQQREIKALVPRRIFEQHLARSVSQAENQIGNAFHCKTPDCQGWCIIEDNVNEFKCPVCSHINCLPCRAIHEGLECREYQDKLRDGYDSNAESKRTRSMLEEMVQRGDAMSCPTCQAFLMKKWGCDWLRCSMCKTEICWVTRGPRWGPGGKGDTTAGCQCGLNGVKCHPKCNYCH